MRRTPIIAANWKMYKTSEEAVDFITHLIPLIRGAAPALVFIAVPFTALKSAVEAAKGSNLRIGAQNMHDALEGAFTGEISARMLKAEGAAFVILGHSERRHLFQESNAFINRKIKRALEEGITPILCIGETEKEREERKTHQVLATQLKECLSDVPKSSLAHLVIAYEPIWAIGTGKTATSQLAQETHLLCRHILKEIGDEEVAEKVPLLYGGSVNPDTIADLMKQPDIDGVLVGGASLQVDRFVKIVHYIPT